LIIIDNLDRNQIETLKGFHRIIEEYFRDPEKELDPVYEAELFLAFGYDNPDVVLLRWLRARKWIIKDAFLQLIETIKWRNEWGVKELLAKGETDLCQDELKSGKSYFMGYDKVGRPIVYIYVKDHIKGEFPPESTEKITVFTMEIGRKLLKPPNESVTVVFDMTGFGLRNMDYQNVKFLINLLQNYYPESFGLGLVINAPWIFNSCWYIIKPWLDPVVESKIHFINNLHDITQYIDPSVLPKRLNGNQPDFSYILPTEEDLAMLATFRNDVKGKMKAEEVHREAVQNYLNITRQWTHEEETDKILKERKRATKELRDAFEQLTPYVSTRTHYHRIGAINEPIFDIVYKRIQENIDI